MKATFTFLIFAFSLLNARSQNSITVDTLEVFEESYNAEVTVYKDGMKTEKYQAQLYPITLKRPKYRLIGNLITQNIEVDSIAQKLILEQYETNGDYTLTSKSPYGIITKFYFDSTGAPMNFEEYQSKHTITNVCGDIQYEFLISGNKIE